MSNRTFSGFAIVGTLICAFGAHAGEQPQKARFIGLTPTELHCTKLADVEGHTICTFEIPGANLFEDGTLGSRVSRGTTDFIDGEGTAQGYTTVTHSDTSTITFKWTGVSKFNADKDRVVEGPYECLVGTGRFAGITCEGTWSQVIQKSGVHFGEYEGTMTLPD